MVRVRNRGHAAAFLVAWWVAGITGAADAQLLARVDPSWSPFYTSPPPAALANLAAESRSLLRSNPARVLQILALERPQPGAGERLIQGLRADAGYQLGGNAVRDARRLYQGLAATSPKPAEQAWARFMIGSIEKGLGLTQEAETAFIAALAGSPGPWAPALEFDTAVLQLETARFREAAAGFGRWLERYPEAVGRPLILYLAGECAVRLNEPERALMLYAEARRLDPDVWTNRPRTGHEFANLLLARNQPAAAVQLLEELAAAAPGTPAAGIALLRVGKIWTEQSRIAAAARAYGRLLDSGTTPEEGREARLRLALLGIDHANRVELTEPYPAYRLFYRPRPTLEEFVAGKNPLAAQRALQGLAVLEQRAGRGAEALTLLSRVFLDYPETRESGRAYESYMGLVETHLEELLRGSEFVAAIDQYLGARRAVAWAPTRDVGSVLVLAAQAYEGVGAPAEARVVYQRARSSGTRALTPAQLDERILYTRVLEHDDESLRQWLASHPADRRVHLALARVLVAEERGDEARPFLRRAEKLATGVRDRLDARSEADRLDAPSATAPVLLEQLRQREELWLALPAGDERVAWERAGRLTEARLQFATGDYAGAVERFAAVAELSAPDTYLLAVAELRSGRRADGLGRLQDQAGGTDSVYREVAAQRLTAVELARRLREVL